MSESEGKVGKRSRRRVSIANEKESSSRAIVAVPKNDGQKNVLRAINENKVTLIDGVAGTGKTYISVTYGLQMLFRGKYKRIIVTRPMVEAGERLGFLPGTMAEKTAPLLMPIFDSFREHLSQMDIDELIEEGKIVILPVAYMRGVTFKDSYVVCDEAQNCTLKQLHMLLTRLGDNSKIVVTGDPSQSDIGEFTGYARAISLVDNIVGLEVIKLDKSCVVRDPIVGEIDERFANKL